MKRRYKEGDWFRVPLDAAYDALGVIARACRSRLFGYFFAIPAGSAATHDMLRSLRAQNAAARALFGGAGLEDERWPMVATSLRFDPDAWLFPQFGSRGAFGRTWSVRTYDPRTMQVCASETAPEDAAANLPDARFAGVQELETLLRERICGVFPAQPVAVAEVRSPLEPSALGVLSRGGRVQFSELPADDDLAVIARYIDEHPALELRVHGFARLDARVLQQFTHLRSLILDVDEVHYATALTALTDLRSVSILPMKEPLPSGTLTRLPNLNALELHGRAAGEELLHGLHRLESLSLVDAGSVTPARFACAKALRTLTLARMPAAIEGMGTLANLIRLELRDLSLRELPDFTRNAKLQSIALRGVRRVRDLRPLAGAPQLRELRIERMPQLEVSDFEPLRELPHLHAAHVDVGSRQKEREIYRLLRKASAS